MSPTS